MSQEIVPAEGSETAVIHSSGPAVNPVAPSVLKVSIDPAAGVWSNRRFAKPLGLPDASTGAGIWRKHLGIDPGIIPGNILGFAFGSRGKAGGRRW